MFQFQGIKGEFLGYTHATRKCIVDGFFPHFIMFFMQHQGELNSIAIFKEKIPYSKWYLEIEGFIKIAHSNDEALEYLSREIVYIAKIVEAETEEKT